MDKPRLSFWQIWNMSFGFLGIQFGWGLQMANMSAIYKYLGASEHEIPMLWLAAPLTGLVVQPIIGHMSDRTWGRLGRRRPYFLIGALLSSGALILMPNSSALWMAAGLLWILDASINVSMEPFRAFVADLLPEEQRTRGFAMQSLFIGLGAVIASALPWLMTNVFGVAPGSGAGAIPTSVKLSFYVGAAAFFLAVLWTVVSTKEYPPDDMAAFEAEKKRGFHPIGGAAEIFGAMRSMPRVMVQLAPVQFCTWLGLFCMWLYLGVIVPKRVFGAPDTSSPLFQQGVEWVGLSFGFKDATCFLFAFALPAVAARLGLKRTHALCLTLGGLGLLSMPFVGHPWLMVPGMIALGIQWASTLSMPYAMLAGALPPARTGVYMGIFNFFIVIPEILAAVLLGKVVQAAFGGEAWPALVLGGVSMIVAAGLTMLVDEPAPAASGTALEEAV